MARLDLRAANDGARDYEVDGKDNHHKVYGYLRTPEMAEILDEFLTDDSTLTTPSVVRRLVRFLGGLKGRLRRARPAHGPA